MELDVTIKGIISVRNRIAEAWDNPNDLSDLGNKMALYNAYLGDHLGEVEADRENAKAQAYMNYIKGGMPTTQADNLSRAEVSELTGQARKLGLMHKDAHRQISMIQSRLKVLENQIRSNI